MATRRTLLSVLASMGLPGAQSAAHAASRWTPEDLAASRIETLASRDDTAAPPWATHATHMLVALEDGGHTLALIDGERPSLIGRVPSPRRLHGAPCFSPDLRHAFFGAPDGWVTRIDLWRMQADLQVRVGLALHGMSQSSDGQWLLAANASPHSAVLLDAQLRHVKTWPVQTADGRQSSAVQGAWNIAARRSFVLALQDIPELWEISYDPKAAPIHDGLVHDYRMGEAIARPGYLGVRRTPLDEPLGDLLVGPDAAYVVGATRVRADGTRSAIVVNLDVRRKITPLPIGGAPHPSSGVRFTHRGAPMLAIPDPGKNMLSVIDARTWKLAAVIALPGPTRSVRSHPALPQLWVQTAPGAPARDTLTVIDTQTLAPLAQLSGPVGQTLGPVAFTHSGRLAFGTAQATDGALIAWDTGTFKEAVRWPMTNPVGVWSPADTGAHVR